MTPPDTPTPPSPWEDGPDPSVDPSWRPETRAVRSGRHDNGRALAPLLWPTTTFVAPDAAAAFGNATTPRTHTYYSRYGNPSVAAMEDAVARLEGAEAAQAFASGMGAVSTVVLALCSKGDHVLAQRNLYAHSTLLFDAVLPRFGIDVTFVDGTDPAGFADAVVPGRTVLVFAETPANPQMELTDLDALGALRGPVTVVDSTFATPVVQRPLDHGVDLVLHSATKGLGGHNDATAGVVAGSAELLQWVWGYHTIHGAAASPFDAWNVLRGIRTLGPRVQHQSATALRLARALEGHPAVATVRYPGLESHPQRDLAKRQMDLGGTILAFELAGGLEAGQRFLEAVRLCQLAPSLGGPETLVTHPASMTAVNLAPDEREAAGITEGLVRVSCGLEHADDVVADVEQALAAAGPSS